MYLSAYNFARNTCMSLFSITDVFILVQFAATRRWLSRRLVSARRAGREKMWGKGKRAAADTAATSKKFRSAIDDSAAEFVCPITQELPVDPVTAEDGRVAESGRQAERSC